MRALLKVTLLVLCSASVLSASVHAQPSDRQIRVRTESAIAATRNALISYTWSFAGFPANKMPDIVIKNDVDPVPGLEGLERVDTLSVPVDRGVRTYAHHFIPVKKNGRLVILHQGHNVTFDDQPSLSGMRLAIQALLKDGYSVLAEYMPHYAVFNNIIDGDKDSKAIHRFLFVEDRYRPTYGTAFRYFLEPLAGYINYIKTRANADGFPVYRNISLVGFSGGGWTSTVYAAIDPRIDLTISIGGTIPQYLRRHDLSRDNEQYETGFYSIAGYQDLYIMGSAGAGRREIQVLNRHDWCCFGQAWHHPSLAEGLSWDDAVRQFENRVRVAKKSAGTEGRFDVEIDETAIGHMVSANAVQNVVLPALSGGRRTVAASRNTDAAAKGVLGDLVLLSDGSWASAGGPQIVGAPAVIDWAVNEKDVFYRDGSGQLIQAKYGNGSWSFQTVAPRVIADPAVVALRPGSLDVVAFQPDMLPSVFSWNGSGWSLARIPYGGSGQMEVFSSGPDQLDLVFKGLDSRLTHARRSPNGAWAVSRIDGDIVDSPAALPLPNGTIRAYANGVDGILRTTSRSAGEGQDWGAWQPVMPFGSMPRLVGSPSAIVVNGLVSIYARDVNGHVWRVDSGSGVASAQDVGGSASDSPTATPDGVVVRGSNGRVHKYQDGVWIDLGKAID